MTSSAGATASTIFMATAASTQWRTILMTGDKFEAVEVDLAAGTAYYLNADGSRAGHRGSPLLHRKRSRQ